MKSLKSNYLLLFIIIFVTSSCDNIKFTNDEIKTPVFQGYIESTQVNVTTRMPGRIMKILVDEGDTLKEGDTVAILDTREILANKEALTAKLRNIAVNKRRLENLYKAGAIPQQKLDEITTGYEMLQAKIKALDTRITDMTITSPIDGIVNVKVLEENQMMPPGMPVVIETDPYSIWARFSIPESYLNQINLGDIFTLKTNTKGLDFKAKVIQILPMASFATHTPTTTRDERDVRTFDIKMLILDNQNQCKPGMSTFLYLKSNNKDNTDQDTLSKNK